jgi:dTDP-4-dehydrorhamnose reductase
MQSVIVLGGSGLVGSRLVELWADRFALSAPTHAQLDVLDHKALAGFLSRAQPQVVVNAAAWADVDAAEAQRGDQRGQVYQLNAAFPRQLAELCAVMDTQLVHVSTDYVFDGTNDQRPYREQDPIQPLCWYAQTKARGEELIRETSARACIARIEMPFTARPHPKRDFARTCLTRLQAGQELVAVTDQRITPVFLDDAVDALGRLIEQRVTGTVHLAASTWITPFDFARAIAARMGCSQDLIRPDSFEHFGAQRAAKRPQHSWLDITTARSLIGETLKSVDEELAAWAAQLTVVPRHV